MDDPRIKVTRIGSRYHIRLWNNNKIYDEMACKLRLDIGWCCRSMLRFFSKCGGNSKFAHAARMRLSSSTPIGKVWFLKHLEEERERAKPMERT